MTDSNPLAYSPALESRETANLRANYQLFVDGEFTEGAGEPLRITEPATGELLTEVASANKSDVDKAVGAARRAFEQTWSRMPGRERGKHLFRIARLLQERARELAVLETLHTGKPVRESSSFDVPAAVAHLFHYAGWADKLGYAGYGPDPAPLGVAAQVVPWNSPLFTLTRKIAPALACGNTVVLKPAETAPLTAVVFAEICQQAQLPAGVVNVLPGTDGTGAALVGHPEVDVVSFTGSTSTGKQVQRALAGTGRKLTAELGGNSAHIVYADAPLDEAVEGIVNGIAFNQGQVPSAGSRVLVQEPVAEELLERLRTRTAALRVGDPLDRNTDVGAVHSAQQLDRLTELVRSGVSEGARRWTSPCPLPDKGFFFAPTIFTGVQQSMRIAREEIRGPVVSVLTFRTPQEAVNKVNNTPYGLAAGIWTEKSSRALWTAQQVRAGVVWANTFHRFDPTAAFGGYQESCFGREGGRAGLEAYLDV